MVAEVLVLRTKLRPPAPGGRLLDRPRLRARLDEATAAPLTLVVAPAGSGKTSLVAGWVAASTGRACAWLSLDETDRDVAQLWAGIAATLGTSVRADTVLETVDALLDDLDAHPRGPTVLVLDDAHVLEGAPLAAESLAMFVAHLPGWLRVVLTSRTTAGLPLSRLRARGLLQEVEYAELRFSPGESDDLLRELAPSLPAARRADLAAHAHGWAASLQLAALATRTGSEIELGLDDAALLNDYLWDEVLAAEEPDVLETLLATSVAERIDAGLAQRLTGRADAPALLELARARGLLVTRLEVDTYRVHDLVRVALVREAERRTPGRVRDLHAVAAQWCAEHDEVALALEHWLAADRPREVVRLLAANTGRLYDAGREETIRRVIARIPPGLTAGDPAATVDLAWCHAIVERERFLELAGELERFDAASPDQAPGVLLIRGVAALSRGDWVGGGHIVDRSAELLGASWRSDRTGQFVWNMIARAIALTERWDDDAPEVVRVVQALSLDAGRRNALQPSRAVGLALAGRPDAALRVTTEAHASGVPTRMSTGRAETAIAEALARRERGERERATRELLEIVALPMGLATFVHLHAWLALAEIRLEDGDLDHAELMFGEASQLVTRHLTGPDARSLLARTGARLALADDRLADAERWAGQVDDDFWGGVVRYRVTADPRHLDGVRPRCPRHRVVLDLLRFRATGDDARLQAALDVAVPLGLVQTVAGEGPEVAAAVEATGWQLPRPWLTAFRAAVARPERRAGVAPVEPLTERELDVLRYLPTTMTLREIADQLYISQNTVKTHVKAIYRKLGCTTRAEVADRLRADRRTARTPGHG